MWPETALRRPSRGVPPLTHGLWSLWDMLRLDASAFHDAMGHLARFATVIEANSDRSPSNIPLSDEVRPTFRMLGERLSTELAVLQTVAAGMRLERLLQSIDRPDFTYAGLAEGVEDVRSRLKDELAHVSVYVLDASKTKYFENDGNLFGKEVATKFPTSAFEIDEAGKCYAVHRYTACVFHLMRVMEIGIQSARKCLGIPEPIKDAERNWGAILRKFKAEIERRNALSPILWSGDDKNFFDSIYASLDAVRNVWRNPTMHVENKYTDDEAEHIFGAVRGFMKKLASRVDEQGQPLA